MANLQTPGVVKQLIEGKEMRKDLDESPVWCWRFGIPRRDEAVKTAADSAKELAPAVQ